MSIAGCEEKAALERRGFRPNFLVNTVNTEIGVENLDHLGMVARIIDEMGIE